MSGPHGSRHLQWGPNYEGGLSWPPESLRASGSYFFGSIAVAEAQETLVVRVVADLATFDSAPGSGGGRAFYVRGQLCPGAVATACTTPIGIFHCWGFNAGGGFSVVNQEYDLFGQGKLMVQGREDTGPRAVVGGTGRFMNVRGQGQYTVAFPALREGVAGFHGPSGLPEFEIAFVLQGAM